MRRLFQSFAARLNFYILTLTIIIFCCIAVVFHIYSQIQEEEEAVFYTHSLLDNMILKIEQKLTDVENSVINTLPKIKQNKQLPHTLRKIVEEMVLSNTSMKGGGIAFVPYHYPTEGEYFMEYIYLDTLNNVCRKRLGGEEYDYFKKEWYMEAKQLKCGIWTEPYYDVGGGDALMTTYALPLMNDEGEVYAVLTADFSLKNFMIDIDRFKPYSDSYSFLLSRKGTYMTHRAKSSILSETFFSPTEKYSNKKLELLGKEMQQGKTGTLRMKIENADVLAFYASIPSVGWSICNICFYKTIMGDLASAEFIMILIFLTGIVVLFICISWLVKHEMKPLEQFAIVAHRIASGNFDYPLPNIKSADEISTLRDSFVFMQHSLTNYIEELKVSTAANERIKNELDIASLIQTGMLLKTFPAYPERQEFDLYATLISAREVGGDLYDFRLMGNKLYFVVGDVSGKGIPASLVMAITQSMFRTISAQTDSPGRILSVINQSISENNEWNMFVTMFVGVLNLDTGELLFCNAGHNVPLFISPQGEVMYLKVKSNLPVGLMNDFDYVEESINLECGSRLLLYTDGVTEAENEAHELFSEQRLEDEVVLSLSVSTTEQLVKRILKTVNAFVNKAEQSDDITLLALSYKGSSKEKPLAQHILKIENKIESVSCLEEFLNTLADVMPLSNSQKMFLNVALEEALSNIILYAYPEGTCGEITLTATCYEHELDFLFVDKGISFNPLVEAEEVDTTLSLEDRPVGRLGIFLIRKLMDELSYQRNNGENRLYMKKKL